MGKILFKPGYSKIIKKVIRGKINIHEIYQYLNHVYNKHISNNPDFLYKLQLEIEPQVDLLNFHEFQYGQRVAPYIDKWIDVKHFEETHDRYLKLELKLTEAIEKSDLPHLKAQLNYVTNRITEAKIVFEFLETEKEEEALSIAYPNSTILVWLEVHLDEFLNSASYPSELNPLIKHSTNVSALSSNEAQLKKPEENKFIVELEKFKSEHPKMKPQNSEVTKSVTGWTEWFVLFKDEKCPSKILSILREEGYISKNNDWIKGKGVVMVALYLALKKKGYLVNSFSNPQIAQAFNVQFKTNFGQKAYQPEEQNKAEKYMDMFCLIPDYKLEETAEFK